MAEELIEDGIIWKNSGARQVYRYPEDIGTKPDPRCQLCGKTSYKAETVTYEQIPYHKDCFKCLMCKKKLTPGTAAPFGDDVFLCTTHYGQAMKRGSSKGEAVSARSANVKATGPSLVTGDGKEQDSYDLADGFNWKKGGGKQVYLYPEDLAGPAARSDPRCHRCGKTAYKAEVVTYEKIPYHKNCFKCAQCKKKLTPGAANPFGPADFLCNTHFKQASMGRSQATNDHDTLSAMSPTTKVTGPSLVVGSSTDHADLSAGHAWRKAGVKQSYRFPEDVEGASARSDPRCHKCGKTSYKAETITYERIPYHKNCFKCVQCKKRLTAGDANPFGEDSYLCNVHYHQVVFGGGASQNAGEVFSASSKEQAQTGPSLVTSKAHSNEANPKIAEGINWRQEGVKQAYKYPEDMDGPGARSDPRCNLCGKTSYKAETVTYERIPYHKNCFKCIQCKKRLTAGGANPFGPDCYLCDAHFMQHALKKNAQGADDLAVVSASSAEPENFGPSSVGGNAPTRKKTKYKPPKTKRRGRK